MKILAIETSCDETAAAVVEVKREKVLSTKILSNIVSSQIEIHKKYGGVFPEHASRAHSENIIEVVDGALGNTKPDLIAVTNGPGLIGSLLVGTTFAKTYSYSKNIPIIGINHLSGHIYANWATKPTPKFPAIILIVSGGHTGLYLMKSHSDIKMLGETLDDAAGEAFDKVAKILGLDYPGGPSISKAALKGNPRVYNFPRSMVNRKDYNFSFSGLKTAVLYESKKHQKLTVQKKNDFAASFQQAVIDILIGKTLQAAKEFKPKSICLCGGVSANKELREQMAQSIMSFRTGWRQDPESRPDWIPGQARDDSIDIKISFHVPPFDLTTDNAAMIGIAAAYQTSNNVKPTTYDKITTDANQKL